MRKVKVKFLSNIGRKDAQVMGVDFQLCTNGAELEIDQHDADWLGTKGVIEVVESKPVQPEIKAVPDAIDITSNKPQQPRKPLKRSKQ